MDETSSVRIKVEVLSALDDRGPLHDDVALGGGDDEKPQPGNRKKEKVHSLKKWSRGESFPPVPEVFSKSKDIARLTCRYHLFLLICSTKFGGGYGVIIPQLDLDAAHIDQTS